MTGQSSNSTSSSNFGVGVGSIYSRAGEHDWVLCGSYNCRSFLELLL